MVDVTRFDSSEFEAATGKSGGRFQKKLTISVGTSNPLIMPATGRPVGVSAQPGGGGTLNVQTTFSSVADVEAGSAVWADWASGAVSSNTTDSTIVQVTAMRFIAATAAGVVEVVA